MLADFFAWWSARIAELLPASLINAAEVPDGIVIDADRTDTVTAWQRRKGREEPIGLGMAARLAARKTVLLRPAADMVLEKRYAVPDGAEKRPRSDAAARPCPHHSLPRPCAVLALGRAAKAGGPDADRRRADDGAESRAGGALDGLAAAGIVPRFLEIDSGGQRRLLPLAEQRRGASRLLPAAGLALRRPGGGGAGPAVPAPGAGAA